MGGLRIAVGHAHHHRFLQAQDVTEVAGKVEEQWQLGGARVAKDGIDVKAAQQVEHGLAHGGEMGLF